MIETKHRYLIQTIAITHIAWSLINILIFFIMNDTPISELSLISIIISLFPFYLFLLIGIGLLKFAKFGWYTLIITHVYIVVIGIFELFEKTIFSKSSLHQLFDHLDVNTFIPYLPFSFIILIIMCSRKIRKYFYPNVSTTIKKRNYLIALISIVIFVLGYFICQEYFIESYTAEWTSSNYFMFVWVAAVLFATLNLPYSSIITTVSYFIGIILGDVINQKMNDINMRAINEFTSNGEILSDFRISHMIYERGPYIWFLTILLFMAIGLIIDRLLKERTIMFNDLKTKIHL